MHLKYSNAIDDTGGATRALAQQLDSLMQDLQAQAKAVLGDGWSGEAASMFETAALAWHREVLKLNAALDRLGHVTQDAYRGAMEADHSSARVLEQFGG